MSYLRPNALDPQMVATNVPRAIEIVRKLLSERPRTFQELLRDGIKVSDYTRATALASSASVSTSAASSEASSSGQSSSLASAKGKFQRASTQAGPSSALRETVVPEGHPFVSANFLKNRVLAVLQSQHLIRKSSSPKLLPAGSPSSSNQFRWFIPPNFSTAAPTSESSESTPSSSSRSSGTSAPAPVWDTEKHWSRLIKGDHPGRVAGAYAQHLAARKALTLERQLASPQKRGGMDPSKMERAVWAWGAREEGLTTVLERDHLNVRRARGRPEKERRRRLAVLAAEGVAGGREQVDMAV